MIGKVLYRNEVAYTELVLEKNTYQRHSADYWRVDHGYGDVYDVAPRYCVELERDYQEYLTALGDKS